MEHARKIRELAGHFRIRALMVRDPFLCCEIHELANICEATATRVVIRLAGAGVGDMADMYRDMADRALDPGLRLEFAERAERYETVAYAVRQQSVRPPRATPQDSLRVLRAAPRSRRRGGALLSL